LALYGWRIYVFENKEFVREAVTTEEKRTFD
jgi:hypothetical protein